MKHAGIAVECLECGKRFTTRSMDPQCPRCHGVDVDVDYAAPAVRRVDPRASVATMPGTGTTPLAEAMHGPTVPCRHCGVVGRGHVHSKATS